MKRALFLFVMLFASFMNGAKGQTIELQQVYIECNDTIKGRTHYEPYRIAFDFNIINNTQDTLTIGAYYAPVRNRPIKYGYFKIKTGTKELFSLQSFHNPRCVLPNDSISFTADLDYNAMGYGDIGYDFVRQFNSYSEIRDCIVNSQISYICVEGDYEKSQVCGNIFHSQEVNMNKYLITFNSEGKSIFWYAIGYEEESND